MELVDMNSLGLFDLNLIRSSRIYFILICCRLMGKSRIFDIYNWVFESPQHKGGYSSIGRTTVCGIDGSLFKSGYPPARVV